MSWQVPYRQAKPAEARQSSVPDVLPSDVLRQVLYPAAGLCMVLTIYAVGFYHARVEQPTYYPSDLDLSSAVVPGFAEPSAMMPAAPRGVGPAGGNDCPTPRQAADSGRATSTPVSAASVTDGAGF
jgi:hypothetical protein